MRTYLAVYFGSVLAAILIMPLVLTVARVLKVHHDPNARDAHAQAIPRIGGVAIFLAMLALTVPVLLLNNDIGERFRAIQGRFITLLAAGSFIFAVGLIDDLWRLRARTKLVAQLAAAVAVALVGIRIDSIAVGDWFTLEFGWFAWPLTIVWIVGVTNAVNLIDGLDGLAAGIAAITCGVIAVVAISTGQTVMAVLMLALLGSLTGFLFYNFNPAYIFMGDGGSMFLGFMLAAASVMCSIKSATLVALALPCLALGVPIFDTLFSMMRRVLERRGLFAPDRRHIHHRLIDLGLNQRHVVLFLYLVTLIAAGLGMFMMLTQDAATLVLFVCVLLLLVLVFRIVGAVRLGESIAQLKRNARIAGRESQHKREFDNAALLLRNAAGFDDWWQAVCIAAGEMQLAYISLLITDRDGTRRTLVWRHPDQTSHVDDLIQMTIPVRQSRPGQALRLELAAAAGDSLEAAGHRTALFTRLIDEHSIAGLPRQGRRATTTTTKIKTDRLAAPPADPPKPHATGAGP